MDSAPPLEIRFAPPGDLQQPIAEIYYYAFEKKLSMLLGSARTAVPILASSLHPELALVAFEQGVVVGIAGLEEPGQWFFTPDRAAMRRILGPPGLIKGLAAKLIRSPSYPHELHLNALAVRPDRRGHGIGTRLLQATCEIALERGLPVVRLEVVDTNLRAQKLYETQGFRVTNVQRYPLARPFAGFSAVITMLKRLA